MNEAVLYLLAEVAMALAGFSGVVVAVRLRGAQAWSPTELRFLWFLIGDSLLIVFFALLPVPMALAGWSDDTIWTICSSLLGSWFIVGLLLALAGEWRERRAGQLTTVPLITPVILYGVSAVALAMGIVLGLSAWDFGLARGQALYVVGLMVLLAIAAVEFLFFISLMSQQGNDQ